MMQRRLMCGRLGRSPRVMYSWTDWRDGSKILHKRRVKSRLRTLEVEKIDSTWQLVLILRFLQLTGLRTLPVSPWPMDDTQRLGSNWTEK